MQAKTVFLACLAWSGEAATETQADIAPLKTLASLLAESNPASAFSASSAAAAKAFKVPSSRTSNARMAGGLIPSDGFVADLERRNILNLITIGVNAVPVGWIAFQYISVFIPSEDPGGGGGLIAMDKAGNELTFEGWLKTHQAGDRQLVQGLKGDAHYLIVNDDKKIEDFALNAVCTHLGCVVPWSRSANKFMCPCHGSQYNYQGKVVRGPAPLSLALAHVNDSGGKIALSPWTETDFRTGLEPWWKP